jgi:hypothetical protein
VQTYCSPSIDFQNNGGLRYAISIDDEAPQIVNLQADDSKAAWGRSVSDNIILSTSKHNINRPGKHIVKVWRVDAGVVLQKILIDFGGVKPSYLGPPESFRFRINTK